MTSSLVGSEMCIRDRSSRCGHGGVVSRCGCQVSGRWGSGSSVCRGSWSVSYTHLTLPTICSV
eukprot:592009-Prorocentrum_lima.AAC.1